MVSTYSAHLVRKWLVGRGLKRAGIQAPVAAVVSAAAPLSLTEAQFDALVLGQPWQRLPEMRVITRD